MKLTDEQAQLLAAAVDHGLSLITPPGSPNDIVWGELADRGIMEPADNMFGMHAWKVTDAGRAALSEERAGE